MRWRAGPGRRSTRGRLVCGSQRCVIMARPSLALSQRPEQHPPTCCEAANSASRFASSRSATAASASSPLSAPPATSSSCTASFTAATPAALGSAAGAAGAAEGATPRGEPLKDRCPLPGALPVDAAIGL